MSGGGPVDDFRCVVGGLSGFDCLEALVKAKAGSFSHAYKRESKMLTCLLTCPSASHVSGK